jgi:hypothetical protein
MGVWGYKLYQDDDALDIKDVYNFKIGKAKSNEEVTKELMEENKIMIEDEETAPIFWFVLADIQWKMGNLLPFVKEKAIHYLKNDESLSCWGNTTDKNYIKRKEELEKLKKQLESQQPPLKRLIVKKAYKCSWNIGDIFAYKIKSEKYLNNYIVFVKYSDSKYPDNNICPIVQVYNEIFVNLPTTDELEKIKYLPQFYMSTAYEGIYKNLIYKCLIGIEYRERNYFNDLIYIGNSKNLSSIKNEIHDDVFDMNNRNLCLIKRFEEQEIRSYESWKNVEYYK